MACFSCELRWMCCSLIKGACWAELYDPIPARMPHLLKTRPLHVKIWDLGRGCRGPLRTLKSASVLLTPYPTPHGGGFRHRHESYLSFHPTEGELRQVDREVSAHRRRSGVHAKDGVNVEDFVPSKTGKSLLLEGLNSTDFTKWFQEMAASGAWKQRYRRPTCHLYKCIHEGAGKRYITDQKTPGTRGAQRDQCMQCSCTAHFSISCRPDMPSGSRTKGKKLRLPTGEDETTLIEFALRHGDCTWTISTSQWGLRHVPSCPELLGGPRKFLDNAGRSRLNSILLGNATAPSHRIQTIYRAQTAASMATDSDKSLQKLEMEWDEQGYRPRELNVTPKDISNAKAKQTESLYKFHPNDAISTSINLRILEMKGLNVLYQPQDTAGEKKLRLWITSPFQVDLLRRWGDLEVQLDDTFATNQYGFELLTILVRRREHTRPGAHGAHPGETPAGESQGSKGFPVAFAVHEKSTAEEYTDFLDWVDEQMRGDEGDSHAWYPKFFLQDNAAGQILGAQRSKWGQRGGRVVLCAFHVCRGWFKAIFPGKPPPNDTDILRADEDAATGASGSNIRNRQQLWQRLQHLMWRVGSKAAATEAAVEEEASEALKRLQADWGPELCARFRGEFLKSYAPVKDRWMQAFRSRATSTTTSSIEAWHSKLKGSFINPEKRGKRGRRLDWLCYTLGEVVLEHMQLEIELHNTQTVRREGHMTGASQVQAETILRASGKEQYANVRSMEDTVQLLLKNAPQLEALGEHAQHFLHQTVQKAMQTCLAFQPPAEGDTAAGEKRTNITPLREGDNSIQRKKCWAENVQRAKKHKQSLPPGGEHAPIVQTHGKRGRPSKNSPYGL